ncbi:selenide, water dikinase SelD [Fusobacterium sp. PH5-44]|uniref:selenide, water dikinase SelD n=1 Tax=unclassified Fusobacterium TaxID=2648384 RepID=UPI003D18FFAA
MKEKILFCNGGGCTAKLGPEVLEYVLKKIPKKMDANLLVGYESSDDACVYKLTDDLALVQTLDFFPPIVEDPYIFGQIAATNALSDIYAMGGEVKTALNIVCFPEKMDLNILGEILRGGSDKVIEAGGVLAGGHSITDIDVKYGLSVTGIINPKKIYKNNTSKAGDHLILTKPLGVGIIMTAMRIGVASKESVENAIKYMTTLNKYSAERLLDYNINACTDVTGFGFLGHLNEMIGNENSAIIYSENIPYIKESLSYANEFFLTGAAQRNRNHLKNRVEFGEGVSFGMEEILFDPQTSGGLIISVSKNESEALLKDISLLGLPCGIVGEIVSRLDSVNNKIRVV